MSVVDTALPAELREQYLSEVATWLPAFLSGATTERLDPLEQVSELLQVPRSDLTPALAIHVLLHPSVARFVEALPRGLRTPSTSSSRPRQKSRSISGGLDWSATMRALATGSPIEGGFVTRPAVKVFDVPANRVLRWTVSELSRLLALALPATPVNAPWASRLQASERVVTAASRVQWLRAVPLARPTAAELASLNVARTHFYKIDLAEATDLVRRFERPTAEDIAALLVQRWFEPTRDWQLFELTILLRIQRALETRAERLKVRPLSHTRSATVTFRLASGNAVRLWYQSWPSSAGASEQLSAAKHYEINTVGSRPDIVIEVERDAQSLAVVLELKATRSGDYLGAGLLQLLSYVRDRPSLFNEREKTAWLVAPSPPPFASKPPDGRQLWAVGADEVADAAIAAVAELSAALASSTADAATA